MLTYEEIKKLKKEKEETINKVCEAVDCNCSLCPFEGKCHEELEKYDSALARYSPSRVTKG